MLSTSTSSSWIAKVARLSICLLPSASALYFTGNGDPFQNPQLHQRSLQHPHSSRDSFTLPLRRVVKPRDNVYNITKSKAPTQQASVAVDQDGEDLTYMVAAKLGTSKEDWYFLIDSASSNSWVMAKECQTMACGYHNLFGSDDSTTLQKTTSRFSITYGTGSAAGIVAKDTMQIGSLKFSSDFGLATNVSDEFASYPLDGILALGRGDKWPTGGVETDSNLVMNELVKQGQIKSKIYGLHLGRSATGNHDGELNFGAVNKARFDGDLNWSKVKDNDNGFWWIALGGAGVGDTVLDFPGREAIMDTGTSFMLIPPADGDKLHGVYQGKKDYVKDDIFYYVPCDTKDSIWLSFNGKRYNIPPRTGLQRKTPKAAAEATSRVAPPLVTRHGSWATPSSKTSIRSTTTTITKSASVSRAQTGMETRISPARVELERPVRPLQVEVSYLHPEPRPQPLFLQEPALTLLPLQPTARNLRPAGLLPQDLDLDLVMDSKALVPVSQFDRNRRLYSL
ncbi:aspartic peptidase domain-containing protein [Dendryphion nanum]|uniref:Aspartic peptidase domain-containing protein n=1 Tax=Dendryphion nanum TaxID=256645 RepID=A0A9P9DTR7_9PLEO|nr:aspartic peptidase domain-containing protein [Dendryphion nanum]